MLTRTAPQLDVFAARGKPQGSAPEDSRKAELSRQHQDHISPAGFASLQWLNMVHAPIYMDEDSDFNMVHTPVDM